MRILQISHYFPPETQGGTQGYVEELTRTLREGGDEVAVVAGCRTHSSEGEVNSRVQDGIEVHRIARITDVETYSGDFGSERIAAIIEELATDFTPDLIHVHHWHGLTGDLVRRLKAKGFPVVLTLHDLFTTCPRFFRIPIGGSFCGPEVSAADCAACASSDIPHLSVTELEGLVEERFAGLQQELAAADLVLAVSAAQRDLLESIPGFAFRGIALERIGFRSDEPAPPPPPPIEGRLRLVNWAGIAPHKGIHLLLEAVAHTSHPEAFPIHLHGGDGDAAYMEELHRRARELEVHFHGPYDPSERFSFAARYDLAVFPSLARETHSLVVDEALRSGIPVVVSDHGAPPERIGDCGVTVPPGDAIALARLLENLLADPARLASLRGGEHAARDLREHVSRVRSRYRDLVAR
jgi:glycosyltransferase involved in cell wall biosynthesis